MSEIGDDPFGAADGVYTLLAHEGEPGEASAVAIHQANAIGARYTRHGNPTVEALEDKVRALEGGGTTLATASGMAAVSHTLLAMLGQGDRLIVHEKIFVGVRALFAEFLPSYGIEVVAVDLKDLDALARALRAPATAAVYFETVSNPQVEVVDAPAILHLCREAGLPAIVDNTLLTPCLYRPLADGADVVIHSASKYIGGHGDAIGGLVTVRDAKRAERIATARRILGGILSPMNAYLLQRGLKTLPMRIARHCDNAMQIAAALREHPKVARVNYAGLPGSPDHARAAAYLDRFSGLLSFEVREDVDQQRVAQGLRLCSARYSFGEPASTVLIQDWIRLIRLSVGLENPDDVIADLTHALDHA